MTELGSLTLGMAETVGLLILTLIGAVDFAAIPIIGSFTVASAVGAVALTAAAAAASLLLAPSMPETNVPRPAVNGTQTMKQAMPPRLFGYGTCRIAGAYMFYDATTAGDSYDVIALHHGKIGGIRYHYLNDDLVIIDSGTGFITDIIGLAGGDIRYKGNSVVVKTRLGLATETHYSEVAAAFPTYWSSAHRGDGTASAMLKCVDQPASEHYLRLPHGLPKLSVVADLTAIYDPRDPAQSRTNPATWTSSRNPVLQIIDLLTSTDHGLGLDWATAIEPGLAALMVQANACDEGIPLKFGGTEPRYESSGFAYLSTDPAEILQAILLTCDGWLAEGPNGAMVMWVGKYIAPTVTFTDSHILGYTIDHGVADEEAVNEIQFEYTPTANDYREAAGTPWRDEADIAERGRVRSQRLPLTWCQSHTQARRLAKRSMARYLARLRGSMTVSLYGLKALGQRWVAIQSEDIADLTNAVVEISRLRIDLARATCTFEWRLVNPNEIDAWNPTTEEAVLPAFPSKIALLGLPAIVGLAGTLIGGVMTLTWNEVSRPDLGVAVEYKTIVDGEDGWVAYYYTPADWTSNGTTITLIFTGPVVQGASYNVRVASRNSAGLNGTFTSIVVAS